MGYNYCLQPRLQDFFSLPATMKKLLTALAGLTLMAAAHAQVVVTAPWVRATVPAQTSTGAFMHLQSAKPVRLVQVGSPAASMVEMHQMDMKHDIMKMQQVDGIELPAGKGVNLASGSYHIMLMGLKQQLTEGQTVNLTLVFEGQDKKREKVTLKVPVKPIGFVGPAAAGPMRP